MYKLENLLELKQRLLAVGQKMNPTADLQSSDGRKYIRCLCKRVLLEQAIEAEKKVAH
ncbi:hypothetical protein [Cohnella sp. AR92]|uniref:hypothetical protein n=1 Tax=Cohnella sp. AR92 TaxID=648716 RepID=UPI0013154E34|nr:hypothetical protein [Cohnella sp. AR92]